MKSRFATPFLSALVSLASLVAVGCGVDASDIANPEGTSTEKSISPTLPAEQAASPSESSGTSSSPTTQPVGALSALVSTDVQAPVDGGTIYGTLLTPRAANPSGKRVILISGGPGAPDYMSRVAETVALAGHSVVRFDARGTGRSGAITTGFEMIHAVLDVDAVRKAAFGDAAVVIIGHSFGGLVGQYFAASNPERTLGLIASNSSVAVGKDQYAEWYSSSLEWMSRKSKAMQPEDGDAYAKSFYTAFGKAADTTKSDAERKEATKELFAIEWPLYFHDPASAPPADAEFLAGTSYPSFLGVTDSVKASDPAALDVLHSAKYAGRFLVISAEDDMFNSSLQWMLIGRLQGNAKYVNINNSGHIPFMEAQGIQDEYYGHIFNFINGLK